MKTKNNKKNKESSNNKDLNRPNASLPNRERRLNMRKTRLPQKKRIIYAKCPTCKLRKIPNIFKDNSWITIDTTYNACKCSARFKIFYDTHLDPTVSETPSRDSRTFAHSHYNPRDLFAHEHIDWDAILANDIAPEQTIRLRYKHSRQDILDFVKRRSLFVKTPWNARRYAYFLGCILVNYQRLLSETEEYTYTEGDNLPLLDVDVEAALHLIPRCSFEECYYLTSVDIARFTAGIEDSWAYDFNVFLTSANLRTSATIRETHRDYFSSNVTYSDAYCFLNEFSEFAIIEDYPTDESDMRQRYLLARNDI